MNLLAPAAFFVLALAWSATAGAVPVVPVSDDVVLERLPEARDPALAALKKQRVLQRAVPQDLRIAASFARRAIDASRATGDPRYLGQAQAALAPWWGEGDAPAAALLLRATIKQSQHDFSGSLADLDRLVVRDPRDVQARLTRATVRGVVGRHDDARADCDDIAGAVPPLVVAACRAAVDGSTARASRAESELVAALRADRGTSASIRIWALTIAGEIAARRGDAESAEARFREALDIDPADAYLLGVYADLLIDTNRSDDAVRVLEPHGRNDALLLRLVIAEARAPGRREHLVADRAELAARFDAARRRGDTVHRREEARYALAVEGDATRAVALARANFDVQKEPADVRVLVDAARAANDTRALEVARAWIATTGLRDVQLAIAFGVSA